MRLRHLKKANLNLSKDQRNHIQNRCTFVVRCLKGCLIFRGNKIRAEKIFDSIMATLRMRVDEHPLLVLEKVLSKIAPKVSLRKKKKGGTTITVPYPISYERGVSIAIHALLHEASLRVERDMAERIASELCDIITNKQTALRKLVTNIHTTAVLSIPNLRRV